MTVELSADQARAQVSTDAIVEIALVNRTDRERRHLSISLEKEAGKYRIVGVKGSASILNQPEPRP